MVMIKQTIKQMHDILLEDDLLCYIGRIAGECYGSSMDRDKCIDRALTCIKNGHHSPWEHYNITMKCVVDRGTSHALVRHRHCAFQQSSTIYQKNNELAIVALPEIDPCTMKHVQPMTAVELTLYRDLEIKHKILLSDQPAHRARDILPNALAANLIITTNIREWMHIVHIRRGPGDAVRMHVFAEQVRGWFNLNYPKILSSFESYYKAQST